MIYLDNSATTRPCPEAVEAMTKAMTESWGNPSALYGFGIDTAHMLRDARHKVAAALDRIALHALLQGAFGGDRGPYPCLDGLSPLRERRRICHESINQRQGIYV